MKTTGIRLFTAGRIRLFTGERICLLTAGRIRLLTAGVAVAAVVLPGSAALGAPDAASRDGGQAAVAWAPCPEDATAECGTLRVPIDWGNPGGDTVDIALARRPATDPAARIGSLVINPGGPGGSGVDAVLFGADYFTAQIRQRFDLVGFDPRGVARSHPVVCSLELLLQAPPPVLTSQADYDRVTAYHRSLGEDCRRRTGPLFDHVDTLSVVYDMDAIRAALGDPKLSYYGISYGTLMGQQYAEVFPQRVRALALDSNMDHSLGTAGFLSTEAWTAQDSFDEFVKGCGRTPSCALYGRDIRALWADLLARAERAELRDPYDPNSTLTPFDLISIAFGSFYGPDWFGLAAFLAALQTGAPPASGAVALRLRQAQQPPPEAVENPFPAVFCEDWRLPIGSYAEYRAYLGVQRLIAPDMRYSPLALFASTTCLGWPARVNNPQHALQVRGGSKLLLLNALHDPATGYLWALDAAGQLGRHAVLATYEGWGHGAYRRNDCTTQIVDRYLAAQVLPAVGTRCPATPPEPVTAERDAAANTQPAGPRPNVPGWYGG